MGETQEQGKKWPDSVVLEWLLCDGMDTYYEREAIRHFKDVQPEHEKTWKKNRELFQKLYEEWKAEELVKVGKRYVYKADYKAVIEDLNNGYVV